jgi:hypothetical protein
MEEGDVVQTPWLLFRRQGRPLHLSLDSLESVCKLLEEILDYTLVVVAPAEDVIQGGEAVCLATLLLMIELFGVEFVIADNTPVVICGVHGEARSKSAVDPDNH